MVISLKLSMCLPQVLARALCTATTLVRPANHVLALRSHPVVASCILPDQRFLDFHNCRLLFRSILQMVRKPSLLPGYSFPFCGGIVFSRDLYLTLTQEPRGTPVINHANASPRPKDLQKWWSKYLSGTYVICDSTP